MGTKDFITGLNILMEHFKDPEGFHLGADHDTIYVYSTDSPIAEHNLKILHELGWGQDACVKDGEWLPEYYSPEESWHFYV